MPNNVDKQTVDWHSGFYAATCFVFRNEPYEILREYELNKQPIRIDVLIKNQENYVSGNGIAKFFRKVNVIEYKNPEDSLSYIEFYKTLGYADLYIGHSKSWEVLPTDITVSVFRDAFPRELFKQLQGLGYAVTKQCPGVYFVTGKLAYPVQVVVTSKLSAKNYLAFKMLSNRLGYKDLAEFMNIARQTKESTDRENIDAILQVSMNVNRELYAKLKREDPIMCEALKEFFKEDLEELVEKANAIEARYNTVKAENKTLKEDNAKMEKELEMYKAACAAAGIVLKMISSTGVPALSTA